MAINIRRICRSGIVIIAYFAILINASAQRQRLANLELSPDSTAGWTIYTDTTGAQQYFTWDSVLYDIYQIDTLGGAGDLGQVGFFGTTDTTTDFNTASWKTIPFPTTYHSDGITGGDSIVISESGKYIIGVNVTFSSATTSYTIKLRILKNGTTPLEVFTLNPYNQVATNYIETFDAAGTSGDYYQLQAIQEADPGTVTLRDQNNGFLIRTTSGGSGPQGPAGEDGADGVSVDSAYVETDSLFVLLSNGDLDGGWYVKGDKGDPGEDGVDGNVLDSNDFYLDTIIQQNDSVYDFEIRNRYGDILEKTLSLTVSQTESTPQVLSTSAIAGGGRTSLDQGGGSFDIIGGTNSTVSITGSEYSISSINNFANSLSFNTGTGQLTIGRNGLSALSESLDGRYATTSGLPWTDEGAFLRPTTSTDDVVIGATTQGTYASELEINGTQTIYGSTGDQNLFAIVDGTDNYRHRLGYNTTDNYSVHRQRNNSANWYTGVNNNGDYYISDGLPTTNQPFVIDGTGDMILNDYPNVRDDVSTAPINFLFTDVSGTVQSSPPGVHPFILTTSNLTVDKNDYIISANAATNGNDILITLPATPPTGKTYVLHFEGENTYSIEATASGSTTVDGISTATISNTKEQGSCLLIYDGAGNYELLFMGKL